MKHICLNCLTIFHVDSGLAYCPLIDCVRCDLVEIDGQLVDVIRGLWGHGVGTKYCCSGHLYERFFNAYLMFDGFYSDFLEMGLAGFRELLIAVKGKGGRVVIEEIEERDSGEMFVVKSVCASDEKNPKQRLKCQVDFVEFFYDVLERMDALWKEAIGQDDVADTVNGDVEGSVAS